MDHQQNHTDQPIRRTEDRRAGWMAKAMILGGVLLMIAALAGVALQYRAQTEAETSQPNQVLPAGPLRVGGRMPDFKLADLNGNLVNLSDYAGRMVLINTWATWCPPCRAEMPYLEELYQKYRSNGFEILAVNAGETRDQAASFAGEMNLTFPILLDPDEELMVSLAINDYPTSILVDGKGTIKAVRVGMFTPEILERDIEPLIK